MKRRRSPIRELLAYVTPILLAAGLAGVGAVAYAYAMDGRVPDSRAARCSPTCAHTGRSAES